MVTYIKLNQAQQSAPSFQTCKLAFAWRTNWTGQHSGRPKKRRYFWSCFSFVFDKFYKSSYAVRKGNSCGEERSEERAVTRKQTIYPTGLWKRFFFIINFHQASLLIHAFFSTQAATFSTRSYINIPNQHTMHSNFTPSLLSNFSKHCEFHFINTLPPPEDHRRPSGLCYLHLSTYI